MNYSHVLDCMHLVIRNKIYARGELLYCPPCGIEQMVHLRHSLYRIRCDCGYRYTLTSAKLRATMLYDRHNCQCSGHTSIVEDSKLLHESQHQAPLITPDVECPF